MTGEGGHTPAAERRDATRHDPGAIGGLHRDRLGLDGALESVETITLDGHVTGSGLRERRFRIVRRAWSSPSGAGNMSEARGWLRRPL